MQQQHEGSKSVEGPPAPCCTSRRWEQRRVSSPLARPANHRRGVQSLQKRSHGNCPPRCRATGAAARGAAPHSAQERFLTELCSRLFATQRNAKQRHTDPEDSFTPQPVTGRSSRACLHRSNPLAPSELSLRIPIRGSSSSRTELGCMMESKDGSQVDVVSYGKTLFFSSQGLGGQSAQRRKRTSFCYMKN